MTKIILLIGNLCIFFLWYHWVILSVSLDRLWYWRFVLSDSMLTHWVILSVSLNRLWYWRFVLSDSLLSHWVILSVSLNRLWYWRFVLSDSLLSHWVILSVSLNRLWYWRFVLSDSLLSPKRGNPSYKTPQREAISLIRPFSPKATPLIRPDLRCTKIIKYYLVNCLSQ